MRRPIRLLPLLPLAGCAPAAAPPAHAPAAAAADTAAPAPLPSTDIFLVDLTYVGTTMRVGAPRNLTGRAGYDNQPAFTADGRALLYTSIRADAQADIYRIDLASGAALRLTRTAESEYSPTPLPAGDGFSVIRVEADSTQRLWRFDARGDEPRLVLRDVRPVGYHAWADSVTLGLFVLGEPPTLRLADTRTGAAEIVARGIGRSIHRVPGRRAIGFVEKLPAAEWWISEIDVNTRRVERLVRTLAGSEDYALLPDGSLLMGQGSRLFRWSRGDAAWAEVADLASAGVRGITRLAVSRDGQRLALVAAAAP